MTRVPDTAFLLSVLNDGDWHELSEIIERSQAQRGHGLTVHSRASDLRKRGFLIEQRGEHDDATGRARSYYRLVSLEKPDAALSTVVDDSASGSSSESDLTLFAPPVQRERWAA